METRKDVAPPPGFGEEARRPHGPLLACQGRCVVLTGMDTCPGRGLAFPDREASARPTIPGPRAIAVELYPPWFLLEGNFTAKETRRWTRDRELRRSYREAAGPVAAAAWTPPGSVIVAAGWQRSQGSRAQESRGENERATPGVLVSAALGSARLESFAPVGGNASAGDPTTVAP